MHAVRQGLKFLVIVMGAAGASRSSTTVLRDDRITNSNITSSEATILQHKFYRSLPQYVHGRLVTMSLLSPSMGALVTAEVCLMVSRYRWTRFALSVFAWLFALSCYSSAVACLFFKLGLNCQGLLCAVSWVAKYHMPLCL